MLCSVSLGATTCTPPPPGAGAPGRTTLPVTSGAAVAGAPIRGAAALWRGITSREPGLIEAGLVMPFACMIAAAGTPYLRDSVSMVSPEPTMIGFPPSHSQPEPARDTGGTSPGRTLALRGGGGGAGRNEAAGGGGGSEPVVSGAEGGG